MTQYIVQETRKLVLFPIRALSRLRVYKKVEPLQVVKAL